jgi:hypothetical protein
MRRLKYGAVRKNIRMASKPGSISGDHSWNMANPSNSSESPMGQGQDVVRFCTKHCAKRCSCRTVWATIAIVGGGQPRQEEVTIIALKGRYRDGSVSDIALRTTAKKLRQGDRLTRAIMPVDQPGGQYDGFYNKAGVELVDIWFEDTFGRKHKLNRARKCIRAMGKLP